jgi:hypothetical protein
VVGVTTAHYPTSCSTALDELAKLIVRQASRFLGDFAHQTIADTRRWLITRWWAEPVPLAKTTVSKEQVHNCNGLE